MWFTSNVIPLCRPFLNLFCIAALFLAVLIMRLSSFMDLVCMVAMTSLVYAILCKKRTKRELAPISLIKIIKQVV